VWCGGDRVVGGDSESGEEVRVVGVVRVVGIGPVVNGMVTVCCTQARTPLSCPFAFMVDEVKYGSYTIQVKEEVYLSRISLLSGHSFYHHYSTVIDASKYSFSTMNFVKMFLIV